VQLFKLNFKLLQHPLNKVEPHVTLWRKLLSSLSKKETMSDYLFLGGLTLTLIAGMYLLKSIVYTSHYLIKGILDFFEENRKAQN
jgi:hypothetical protein